MDPIFFINPSEFRAWLAKNYDSEKELWVGYYKKATGLPSMTWPESVEEALCYGWIDGLRKKVDEKAYKIRFTPRRKDSNWSQVNLKMMERLIENGKMQEPGLKIFQERDLSKSQKVSYELNEVILTKEYEDKIKTNGKAWEFFSQLAPGYKKQTCHWVMQAKREETRLRRLQVLIDSAAEGKKIPHLRR